MHTLKIMFFISSWNVFRDYIEIGFVQIMKSRSYCCMRYLIHHVLSPSGSRTNYHLKCNQLMKCLGQSGHLFVFFPPMFTGYIGNYWQGHFLWPWNLTQVSPTSQKRPPDRFMSLCCSSAGNKVLVSLSLLLVVDEIPTVVSSAL